MGYELCETLGGSPVARSIFEKLLLYNVLFFMHLLRRAHGFGSIFSRSVEHGGLTVSTSWFKRVGGHFFNRSAEDGGLIVSDYSFWVCSFVQPAIGLATLPSSHSFTQCSSSPGICSISAGRACSRWLVGEFLIREYLFRTDEMYA